MPEADCREVEELNIRVARFSGGFVMVPMEDVILDGGGYLAGFKYGERDLCYHCDLGGCILYRDVTPD